MKSLSQHINEKLSTKEVDSSKFPDGKRDKDFFKKGLWDGQKLDDTVKTKKVALPAQEMKASQDAVYLGKALGLAIAGVSGGDLGSIVSKDKRILDGHHRWAATIFNQPDSKITATQAMLDIGDLIPVLRSAGDAMGNQRGVAPSAKAKNIFKATIDDVVKSIYDGVDMDPKFYDREKSIKWFESIGKSELEKRLNIVKSLTPPKGAPARKDMPKIEPEQVDTVAKALDKGNIDVRAPYVNEEFGEFNTVLMHFKNETEVKNDIANTLKVSKLTKNDWERVAKLSAAVLKSLK